MSTHDSDHDRTAELLTQTLADEASTIEPAPGALQDIQRRTRSAPPARRRWVWGSAGAALATAAVIAGIILVSGNGSDHGKTPAADAPGSVAAEPDVTLSLTYFGPKPGNPEGSGPGAPGDMPRLFEETRTVPGIGKPTDFQAVHEFLTTDPADPDYATGWPSGVEVKDIVTSGGVTTIDLRGNADLEAPGDLDKGQRIAAIQALVKTADTGAPVQFVYNAVPLSTLFGIDVSSPVQAMSEDDSRAWISIDNITEGQTVDNPVSVDVTGNVFEGNVNWSMTDENGATVDEGYATTSMGSWTTASVDLGQLDPGTYTFEAHEVSMADGDEINVDSKTFTVD